ncbi:MAG: hypothetical protein OIF50_03275 [Flavobacteriaceae bacterium]|nr:hypothetical protein [Flavobacteriaceae bacterium]
MNFFLILYFGGVLLLGITRLSLLKGKVLLYGVLIPSLITASFYKFSIAQNNQMMEWLLSQQNLVSGIAILLTFEAILIVFLTIVQIKSYYGLLRSKLWKWISLLPMLQLVFSMVFFQTFLMLNVHGYNLLGVAIGFFIVVMLLLWLLAFLFQKGIPKWEQRAEMQALIGLFQLLLAMFLPLLARGQKLAFSQITIDSFSICFSIGIVLLGMAIGFQYYNRKNKNYI